jgi:hypothetical protein
MVRFGLAILGTVAAVAAGAALVAIGGLPTSGAVIGGVVGGIAVAIIALVSRARSCPRCGTELPRFRMPASSQQALWGGWTCPKCGYEVDRRGQPVGGTS